MQRTVQSPSCHPHLHRSLIEVPSDEGPDEGRSAAVHSRRAGHLIKYLIQIHGGIRYTEWKDEGGGS
jgi:hypothetical protein